MNRNALKWVINYKRVQVCRGELLLQTGTKHEIDAQDALRRAFVTFQDDGHSSSRYSWIRQQSQLVDKIGWTKWMELENNHFKKQ